MQAIGRADVQLSQNHSVFGRYMATTYKFEPPFAASGNVLSTTLGGRDNLAQSFALGDTTGMVKFLADAKTDEILGVHIIGPFAGELIAEAVVAMEFRGSAEDIGMICHAHPSLSEAMKDAALGVDKRSLNI